MEKKRICGMVCRSEKGCIDIFSVSPFLGKTIVQFCLESAGLPVPVLVPPATTLTLTFGYILVSGHTDTHTWQVGGEHPHGAEVQQALETQALDLADEVDSPDQELSAKQLARLVQDFRCFAR